MRRIGWLKNLLSTPLSIHSYVKNNAEHSPRHVIEFAETMVSFAKAERLRGKSKYFHAYAVSAEESSKSERLASIERAVQRLMKHVEEIEATENSAQLASHSCVKEIRMVSNCELYMCELQIARAQS